MNHPWTWQATRVQYDGETFFELRVAELPDFLVASDAVDELLQMRADALEVFLLSYLEHGQTPPFPQRARVVQASNSPRVESNASSFAPLSLALC